MFQFDEPFGNTIFCDDIRNEIGGKNSYMGVYPGSVAVPAVPYTVPKFAVVATLYEPRSMALARTWNVVVRLFLPGDSENQPTLAAELPPISREIIAKMDQSMLPEDEDVPKLVAMNAGFVLAPMTLRQVGRIKVRATYKEGMVIRLGTCRVDLAQAQPTVSPISP